MGRRFNDHTVRMVYFSEEKFKNNDFGEEEGKEMSKGREEF